MFCYVWMPFGLRNRGATFARLIEKVFVSQYGRNVAVHVDDIVVKSKHEVEHLQDPRKTFINLRQEGIHLNLKKCVTGVRSGKLLSFLMSTGGIKAN